MVCGCCTQIYEVFIHKEAIVIMDLVGPLEQCKLLLWIDF